VTGDPLIPARRQQEKGRKRPDAYVEQTLPLIEHYNDWAKTGDPSISLKAPEHRRISGLGGLDEIRRACPMR
jgi:adenylate kinase